MPPQYQVAVQRGKLGITAQRMPCYPIAAVLPQKSLLDGERQNRLLVVHYDNKQADHGQQNKQETPQPAVIYFLFHDETPFLYDSYAAAQGLGPRPSQPMPPYTAPATRASSASTQ